MSFTCETWGNFGLSFTTPYTGMAMRTLPVSGIEQHKGMLLKTPYALQIIVGQIVSCVRTARRLAF